MMVQVRHWKGEANRLQGELDAAMQEVTRLQGELVRLEGEYDARLDAKDLQIAALNQRCVWLEPEAGPI